MATDMNDAQFNELLKHIDMMSDRIGDVIIVGCIIGGFIVFISVALHAWTRI